MDDGRRATLWRGLDPVGAVVSQFGKYLLDGEIARGGMSRVYHARLRGPGGFEKKLVVKQILPQLAEDPNFVQLFVQEANTLVQMGHSNIVPVYELGVVDGVYYLAMELVRGATVAELLSQGGPLPEALCAHIGVQVCDALRYAHERFGLAHRDVTPRNVIIDGEGHARLLDFGIAAPLERAARGVFGSPGYMSPEQARGDALSEKSDLFSLGAVLYEALTGQRAIERISESGATADAPRTLDENDAASPALAALINQLLSIEPAERPASARAVARQLRTWLSTHRPEGVAAELGQRAEQALDRRTPPRHADDVDVAVSGTPSAATPRVTRSIAQSSALEELISQVTEPLSRPGAETALDDAAPAPAAEAAPRESDAARVPASVWIGVGGALAVSVFMLFVRPSQVEPRSEPITAPRPAPIREPAPLPAAPAMPVVAPSEPPAAPSAPSDDDAPAAEPPAASAQLTINALPWANVQLDGRALGNTPQRKLALRAGKHTVTVDCPPLGKKHSVPLTLAAGDHVQLVVDLTHDPPTVSLK